MKSILVTTVIIFTCLFTFSSGAAMKTYDWNPSESAAVDSPMQMMDGTFVTPDGTKISWPKANFVNSGWGKRDSIVMVGAPRKPLPQYLVVHWLDFKRVGETKASSLRAPTPKS